MNKVRKFVVGILNWFAFSYAITGMFGGKTPETLLIMIAKFINLESPLYPDSKYIGRNVKKSNDLLQALINSYIKTKSEVTLDQIFEVLKKEFIEREQYGRK